MSYGCESSCSTSSSHCSWASRRRSLRRCASCVHVSGEETEGRYALLETHVPQGDMPPLHVHHEEDEVFHVLDGEVTLFCRLLGPPGALPDD
jgi:quercetin dioxygenase-like cupin family protein